MTDRASLSAQVAWVKDIERIRGGFSASVLQSAMDLLFVILFAPVIYQIAGWVVLVPIVAIGLLIIGGASYAWLAARRTSRAARTAAREALLLEAIGRMRSLRIGSSHERWRERFLMLTATSTDVGLQKPTAQCSS